MKTGYLKANGLDLVPRAAPNMKGSGMTIVKQLDKDGNVLWSNEAEFEPVKLDPALLTQEWNRAIAAAANLCAQSDRYRGDYFADKIMELKK
jgi:hypothetical protein